MKKIFAVLILMIVFLMGCETPTTPVNPNEKKHEVVEFMYIRVMPILDQTLPETQGCAIKSDEFGGINLPPWIYLGDNKWQIDMQLRCSGWTYHVFTIDMKVTGSYTAVAEDFYARIKGSQDWIKLPISQHGTMQGKWANFILDSCGLRLPQD